MNYKKLMGTALVLGSMVFASAAFAAEGWQNVDNAAEKISLIVPSEWNVTVGGDAIFSAVGGDINMTMTKSPKASSIESLNRIMTVSREKLLQEVKMDFMKKNPRARLLQCGFVEHPLRSEIRIIATVPEVNAERHYQMNSMFLVNHTWYKVVSNYPMDPKPGTAQDIQKCIKSLSFE